MCFLYLILKAASLKRKLRTYIRYKTIAHEETTGKPTVKPTFMEKIHFWWLRNCPLALGGSLGSKQVGTEMSGCQKFRVKLFTDGTFENYLFKSSVGFISGVCLTYLVFVFFTLQLNFSLVTATFFCCAIGIVMSLGLAFSRRFRCIVLMMIPQLFSKTGRQALIAYAFILVLTGPARNTLHNARVLSESMVCEQENLKKSIKTLIDLVKKPFIAIKHSLEQIMEKVEGTIIKMKYLVTTITNAVLSLLGVVKSAFAWLNTVAGMCNKKMGTPYERCTEALQLAIQDCKTKLTPSLHWMCSITHVSSPTCYSVKFVDYVCEGFQVISDDIVDMINRRLKEFSYQVRSIFYVSVDYSHDLEYEGAPSKNVSDIASGIAGEIRVRTSAILALFDWMSFAISFFFLYTIYQTLKYRRNFLLKEWFDNRYITDNFIQIDLRRVYMGKEAVLPLTIHEKQKYIRMNSLKLVRSERHQLMRTAVYLILATIKLSIHILADYSLFWILSMVRYHGQFQTGFDAPPELEVNVNGKGIMADIYLSIVKAFQPEYGKTESQSMTCLPQPKPPDMPIYKQIVSLIVICWLLSILEAYGLRLRNYIMCYYYPAAAQNRSVWLYNHVNRKRSTFLKSIRRQLRRKFGLNYKSEEMSFMDKFAYRFPSLARWCGLKAPDACLVCGSLSEPSLEPLIRCENANCIGIYCRQCFTDLKNTCTICQMPINYGDLSDISEEIDSSGEDENLDIPLKRLKHEKVNFIGDSTDSDTDGNSPKDGFDYSYQKLKRNPLDKPSLGPTSADPEQNEKEDKILLDDAFPPTETQMFLRKRCEVPTSKSLFQKKMSNIFGAFPRLGLVPKNTNDLKSEHKEGGEKTVINSVVNEYSTNEDSSDSETTKLIFSNHKVRYRKTKKRKDQSEESQDKREQILSLLAPSFENSSVDLSKVDVGVQTDSISELFHFVPPKSPEMDLDEKKTTRKNTNNWVQTAQTYTKKEESSWIPKFFSPPTIPNRKEYEEIISDESLDSSDSITS